MKNIIALLLILFVFKFTVSGQDDPHRRANYTDASILIDKTIDSIVVYKAKREMIVFNHKNKIKSYVISLGYEPLGCKRFEGDLKTPEGLYFINDRNKYSSYHKNLGISYPNIIDSFYARINGQSPGGEIKIHGFPNKHRKDQEQELLNTDWTVGCIAVSDWEIDELYNWVGIYCPILILP
jgi:murein L,D-transpeptidase YafK